MMALTSLRYMTLSLALLCSATSAESAPPSEADHDLPQLIQQSSETGDPGDLGDLGDLGEEDLREIEEIRSQLIENAERNGIGFPPGVLDAMAREAFRIRYSTNDELFARFRWQIIRVVNNAPGATLRLNGQRVEPRSRGDRYYWKSEGRIAVSMSLTGYPDCHRTLVVTQDPDKNTVTCTF